MKHMHIKLIHCLWELGIVTYSMSSRLLEAYCWVTNVFISYWVVGWMDDNINSLNVQTYSMSNGLSGG